MRLRDELDGEVHRATVVARLETVEGVLDQPFDPVRRDLLVLLDVKGRELTFRGFQASLDDCAEQSQIGLLVTTGVVTVGEGDIALEPHPLEPPDIGDAKVLGGVDEMQAALAQGRRVSVQIHVRQRGFENLAGLDRHSGAVLAHRHADRQDLLSAAVEFRLVHEDEEGRPVLTARREARLHAFILQRLAPLRPQAGRHRGLVVGDEPDQAVDAVDLLLDDARVGEIVFRSFAGLGLTAGGGTIGPDDLLKPGKLAFVGFDAAKPMLTAIKDMLGFPAFFGNALSILVLFVACRSLASCAHRIRRSR